MNIRKCTFKIAALVSIKTFLHQNIKGNADLRTYIYQALSGQTW